jgi:hypothetical protein
MTTQTDTLTPSEERAVRALQRAARSWPRSLWLFAGAGSLHVMRAGPDGQPVMTAAGGVDPDAIVDTINIPCDGGDW